MISLVISKVSFLEEKKKKSVKKKVSIDSISIFKLFSNQSLINRNLLDINHLLIQLIDIIKIANLNDHVNLLNDSLFSMIYNLTKEKIQSNECKYLDLCIVNDVSTCLADYLGRLNHTNTVGYGF